MTNPPLRPGVPNDPDVTYTSASAPGAAREFGQYQLFQPLGEGGMGEVWLARQREPVQRQVAIKILKAGMDSARVIARFDAERQTLALMDHPTIAKIFDAGTSPEGRPYFVMDYVRGEPITSYCDRQRLPVGDRLELFIQLCEGVQHAHQKGIIHRDLKPSNVLVTTIDDRPAVRIIDFGIAKAVAQPLSGSTLFTELGGLVGTPEYMSPEQADLSSLDVDTRSDVYSLGLMLYELLAGVPPFDWKALRQAGFDEIRRTIRERSVPRPSTQITRRTGNTDAIAADRHTQPAKLAGLLRGDLDWITIKALEKDRARRYATANAMAMDIRRHLANEPVLAGPPSALYRAGKFMRRHRVAVAAVASLAFLLIVFAAVMAVQARRIARERDRANQEAATARQVSDFLAGLFKVSDPSEARGNTLTAREILARGSQQLDEGLRDQPQVQARLQATIGSVYNGLGLYADAQRMLEQALAKQRRLTGEDSPESLATANELANAYWYLGRLSDAEPIYVDIVQRRTRLFGPDDPNTLRANFDLASLYVLQARWDDFDRVALDTLARQRRVLGDDHSDTLGSLNNLQSVYYRRGRFADAEPVAIEVYEKRRRALGDDHPDTLKALHNVATIADALGRFADAEPLYLRALEGKRRVLGAEHPDTCATLARLSAMYVKLRRFGDAEPLALTAYRGYAERLGVDNRTTRRMAEDIVALYQAWGRPRDAQQWQAKLR